MKDHIHKLLIGGYIFSALITFGVSYNVDYVRFTPTSKFFQPGDEAVVNLFRAAFDAAAWPIYLSVKVFEPLRAKP